MEQPETVQVQFDLTRDQSTMKPRYVQGRELPDWENGPDMHSYLRMMFDQGYRDLSKGHAQTYYLKRAQGL